MRFVRLLESLQVRTRFVIGLLIGASLLLPMTLSAQEKGFLVLPSYKDPKVFDIWVADCSGISATAKEPQDVKCTLVRQECRPGRCKFDVAGAADRPGGLTFGTTTYNPGCKWIYNWTTDTRSWVCWP